MDSGKELQNDTVEDIIKCSQFVNEKYGVRRLLS